MGITGSLLIYLVSNYYILYILIWLCYFDKDSFFLFSFRRRKGKFWRVTLQPFVPLVRGIPVSEKLLLSTLTSLGATPPAPRDCASPYPISPTGQPSLSPHGHHTLWPLLYGARLRYLLPGGPTPLLPSGRLFTISLATLM